MGGNIFWMVSMWDAWAFFLPLSELEANFKKAERTETVFKYSVNK